jgi:hypothetical protein
MKRTQYSVRTEILFANNLTLPCPPFNILSNHERIDLQPTITTIFNKPLPSNAQVNNVSNFIAYCLGRHGVLLASEDFYNLWNYLQKKNKNKKERSKNFLMKKISCKNII